MKVECKNVTENVAYVIILVCSGKGFAKIYILYQILWHCINHTDIILSYTLDDNTIT